METLNQVPEGGKREKDEERRAAGVPFGARAASQGRVPWSGSIPNLGGGARAGSFSWRAILSPLARGEIRPLLIALGTTKLAKGLAIGIGLAAATFLLVKSAEHEADELGRRHASLEWPSRAPADASSLRNEGLVGQIPGVFSVARSPAPIPPVSTSEAPAEREPGPSEGKAEGARGAKDADEDGAAIGVRRGEVLRDAPARRPFHLVSLPGGGRFNGSMLSSAGAAALGSGLGSASLQGAASSRRARAFRRVNPNVRLMRARSRLGRSSRAMGQLKLANDLSRAGRNASTGESGAAYSAGAFDQQAVTGAGVGSGSQGRPTGGAGLSNGPSGGTGGAGGAGDDGGPIEGGAPEPQPEENKTPWQEELDQAKKDIKDGKRMKTMGIALIVAGLALIAAAVLFAGFGGFWGWAMLIAGLGMVAFGMTQVSQAKSKLDEARATADRIQKEHGQQDQGRIVREEANAAESGDARSRQPRPLPSNTVHDDVEAERSSGYSVP